MHTLGIIVIQQINANGTHSIAQYFCPLKLNMQKQQLQNIDKYRVHKVQGGCHPGGDVSIG